MNHFSRLGVNACTFYVSGCSLVLWLSPVFYHATLFLRCQIQSCDNAENEWFEMETVHRRVLCHCGVSVDVFPLAAVFHCVLFMTQTKGCPLSWNTLIM